SVGQVDVYGLLDHGIDRTTSGREVKPEDDLRGIALAEDTTKLSEHWLLQTQLSLISDPTFVTYWRQDDFVNRREYESSVYLKYQNDRTALTLLGKYNFDHFLSNDYLLASRQYSVNKLPELTYRRYADTFFDDRLSYSSESRLSRLGFSFEERTPREIGVRGRAFGLGENDDISDALRARGLNTKYVDRFDTRHEFTLPMEYGPVGVSPFVVGRLTAYDSDFDEFSSDSDALRVFGAVGVRLNTQIQRVYNDVESRLFGLHRLRHVVEPNITIWHGYSTVSQDDLPEYDPEVESLVTGSAIKLGVVNTWQTQRGGPGRWYSVDVLTWNNEFIFTSDDGERESPTPQFFDYRPEYSQFGDHFHSAFTWQISDSLALSGDGTYDLDEHQLDRGAIGIELRHTPNFSTYIEYRTIKIDDTELLSIGWNYQITAKYFLSLSPDYDFHKEDFRSVTARLTRRFPDVDFTVRMRYDQIQNDTSIGASMEFVSF
ncbi:MAG TPA: LPS assembly protein LptD, partial [Phycisphaerales bacterium]|nr:LPS assembly protein LptD [Phycisphaerales bacterium]